MVIKIENRTEDDIIVTVFDQEVEISNGEDAVFESDGRFTLVVKRKRIPEMTKAAKKKLPIYEEDATPASHIQLRGEFEIEPISSKTVVTLTSTARLFDTLHEDAIFVGYKAEISGGKIVSYKETFSNEKIKKEYKSKQITGAVFPIGLVGAVLLIIGVYCVISALGGKAVNFLGNEIDIVYSVLVAAAGALVTGVFVSNIIKILKRIKEYG